MKTESRYGYLDGMRGIAALCVLTRHTGAFWTFSLYRSYLAVDLFFILSGFVISYAYDEKIESGKLRVRDFVLIRLIRLYPVYFLSVIFCIISLLSRVIVFNDDVVYNNIFSVISLTVLFLPSKVIGSSQLFPINGPYWSLFFELIVNFIYVFIRRYLTTRVLILIIMLFGVAICTGAYIHGNLDMGLYWGTVSNVAGISRAIFGIFMGLFLHRKIDRLAKYIPPKMPVWFGSVGIFLVLISPSVAGFDYFIDIISVTIIFPIFVLFSTNSSGRKDVKILSILGSASYPVYVFHVPVYAFFLMFSGGLGRNYAPYTGIAFIIFMVFLSVVVERYYDVPIRRWISRKLLNNKKL